MSVLLSEVVNRSPTWSEMLSVAVAAVGSNCCSTSLYVVTILKPLPLLTVLALVVALSGVEHFSLLA